MTTPTLPDLISFDTHYGIKVSYIGEDGDMIALGHHDERRSIAAFNQHARQIAGLLNIADSSRATYAGTLDSLSRTYAERTDGGGPGDEWCLEYPATSDRPGAFPVMVLRA